MSGSTLAQQNENISFSEERKDSSDYRYRRLYQYLDINMKDEKRMFKVSPDFSLSKHNKQLGLQLSYEFKIRRQFSFIINNSSNVLVQNRYYGRYFRIYDYYGPEKLFHTNIGADFRWYFNLNQRIKNGTSGNNLSGLYVEAGVSNIGYFSNGTVWGTETSFRADEGFHAFQTFDPRLAIGFQRRFNNWSYFDVFTTVNRTYGLYYWDLGFRLGFAWGK
jgi:hypothetical protein